MVSTMLTNEEQNATTILFDTTTTFLPPPLFKQSTIWVVLISIAYSIVAVLGFIGNLIVILVVFFYPPLQKSTNFFFVNLALADLMFALLLPANLFANIFPGIFFLILHGMNEFCSKIYNKQF